MPPPAAIQLVELNLINGGFVVTTTVVDWPHEGLMTAYRRAGLLLAGFLDTDRFLSANPKFILPNQDQLIMLGDEIDRHIGILTLEWRAGKPEIGIEKKEYPNIWPKGTRFLLRRPKK